MVRVYWQKGIKVGRQIKAQNFSPFSQDIILKQQNRKRVEIHTKVCSKAKAFGSFCTLNLWTVMESTSQK